MENQHILAQRARHHSALETLVSPAAMGIDGLFLWRKLRRVEVKACKLNEDECNVPMDADKVAKRREGFREEVRAIFGGKLPDGFFINTDPRGYALKLDNEAVDLPEGLERDFGGYGILAPEIS